MRALAAVLLVLAGATLAATTDTQRGTLEPALPKARAGTSCIADPATMRREHPGLLRHQRDETVRGGVRGTKVSLKACVECHASSASGSVAATRGDFCVGCHSYAAVKIDCFECHASKPAGRGAFHPLTSTQHGGGAAQLAVRYRQLMIEERAERRAAPTPARISAGDRPTYPSAEGLT
jgi:predicted CXXCH cytochrome family protein